jgi:hypothetical protein
LEIDVSKRKKSCNKNKKNIKGSRIMNQELGDFELVYGENISEHLMPASDLKNTRLKITNVPPVNKWSKVDETQIKIRRLETRIDILNQKLDMYKKRIIEQETRIMNLENTLKMLGMN